MWQITEKIKEFLSTGNLCAAAVSGGPDSMALAVLMQRVATLQNKYFIALIVDHKLRPESTNEALFTQHNLIQYGINSCVLTWEHEEINHNIQEQAREARYSLLIKYCKEHHISTLALGHHMDDQVETVMMRILRGSGADGVSAMRTVSIREGVTLFRPLLEVTKEEILKFLHENNINYALDPSNDKECFDRVAVRNVTQSWPLIWKKRVADFAIYNQRISDYLQEQTDLALVAITITPNLYDLPKWQSLPEEIALRVLRCILVPYNAKLRYRGIITLYRRLLRGKPGNIAGKLLIVQNNTFSLTNDPERQYTSHPN